MAKKPKQEKLAALITGAGSGIGRATAELLLEDGWWVALLDKNEAALAEADPQGMRLGFPFWVPCSAALQLRPNSRCTHQVGNRSSSDCSSSASKGGSWSAGTWL